MLTGDAAKTYFQGPTLNLLYPNHFELQQVVKQHDSIHHHLGKEIFLLRDQLGAEGGDCTFLQKASLFSAREGGAGNTIKIVFTY